MSSKRKSLLDFFSLGEDAGREPKARKQSAALAPRTVDGSAFTTCPLCSRQVPLASINAHIDEELLSQREADAGAEAEAAAPAGGGERAAAAAAEGGEQAAGSGGRCSEQPSDAAAARASGILSAADGDAKAAARAALQLRWKPDALPAGCKYGQHTGRAAGYQPPVHTDPHWFHQALEAAEQHERDDDDDDKLAENEPDDDFGDGWAASGRGGGAQKRAAGSLGASISGQAPRPAQLRVPVLQRVSGVPGHMVFEDFITEEEEASLLRHLDADTERRPWRESRFNGSSRGKRYGVEMDLARRSVSPASVPMPEWLAPFTARMRGLHKVLGCYAPNECNAIDYRKARGDFLSAHVDDRQLSGDLIVNLSLAGDCLMTYTCAKGGAGQAIDVYLPRRCLQVQSGAARYNYTHEIKNSNLLGERRVSITFRESALTATKTAAPAARDAPRRPANPWASSAAGAGAGGGVGGITGVLRQAAPEGGGGAAAVGREQPFS